MTAEKKTPKGSWKKPLPLRPITKEPMRPLPDPNTKKADPAARVYTAGLSPMPPAAGQGMENQPADSVTAVLSPKELALIQRRRQKAEQRKNAIAKYRRSLGDRRQDVFFTEDNKKAIRNIAQALKVPLSDVANYLVYEGRQSIEENVSGLNDYIQITGKQRWPNMLIHPTDPRSGKEGPKK